ncbi:MAG: S1C family serine protease [Planctomycetota bacterium]
MQLLPCLALFCLSSAAIAQQADSESVRFTTEARVYLSSGPAVVNIGVYLVSLSDGDSVASLQSIPATSRQVSQGTGVIIDERGLVITNAHVVNHKSNNGAIVYKLSFAEQFGGKSVLARLHSIDAQSDLALLKILDGEKYMPIVFAEEDDLMIGEKVIAIGSPLGNSHSLTSGILSGINRDIDVKVARGKTLKLKGLIQTDAAINFGNSGGPLLNSLGELIGINNATAQSADGIGYAIPIKQVNQILHERLRRPRVWLGVQLKNDSELIVEHIYPRSPAASQGMMLSDRLAAINGVAVTNLDDFFDEMILIEENQPFVVDLQRGNRSLQLELSLPNIRVRDTLGALGFEAKPVTRVYHDEYNRSRRLHAAEVTTVIANSPASNIGLKVGDTIHSMRKTPEGNLSGWAPVASMAQIVQFAQRKDFVRGDYNIMWSSADGSYQQGKLVLINN